MRQNTGFYLKMKSCALILLVSGFFGGCAGNYVFKEQAPVESRQDAQPSAVPQKTGFDFVEYSVSSSVRYPVVEAMDLRRDPRSGDVNAMDEVPASSWYTPRLGKKEISPEILLEGPAKLGPPQPPFQVVKAKKGGNGLGFVIKDARGHKYLLKFDSSEFPHLQSTVNLVTNRLFWGFGYNVPEDYMIKFKSEDLSISPDSNIAQEDVDRILTLSAGTDEEGYYRVTASLFLAGKILGPISQRGIRRGDTNDRIPHEDLRILRALRVFSAWTDHSGIRSDNSLDVYEGEEGSGHTVHYLLDFGEALGAHGAERGRKWDSFEYFFSFEDTLKNYLHFGFPRKPWEKLSANLENPKGNFEAEVFKLKEWRETTQFLPIRKAQPADDYWAAKVIGSVTRVQMEKLFQAGAYPDPDYGIFMIETLLKRREIIFRHVFSRVSAIESRGFTGGRLILEDRGKILLGDGSSGKYRVALFNRNRKQMAKPFFLEKAGASFEVEITPETFQKAKGYVRAEVLSYPGGNASERPAEFHVRQGSGASPKLVGVVH